MIGLTIWAPRTLAVMLIRGRRRDELLVVLVTVMPDAARNFTLARTVAGITFLLVSSMTPATAVDCTKAATNVESAICSNEALLDADKRMTDAFQRLADQLSEDAKQALKQSQRKWLKRRGWCENSDKPLSQCVLRETIDRTRVLTGEPLTGPGTGQPIMPVFLIQRGNATQYDVDVTVLRFMKPKNPGQELFNTLADKLLEEAPMGTSQEVASPSVPYSHQLSMSVPFASAKFISAKAFLYLFSGGAHGNSSTRNINIDLAAGRTVQLQDIFKPSATPILVQSCFAQIQTAKEARFGSNSDGLYKSDERRQIVNDTISEMVNWSFTDAGASVIFDPYAIGAFAEGRYECRFKMDFLQALMTESSPLARS